MLFSIRLCILITSTMHNEGGFLAQRGMPVDLECMGWCHSPLCILGVPSPPSPAPLPPRARKCTRKKWGGVPTPPDREIHRGRKGRVEGSSLPRPGNTQKSGESPRAERPEGGRGPACNKTALTDADSPPHPPPLRSLKRDGGWDTQPGTLPSIK